MSTFYLLPSRPLVGERFASFLGTIFPGLSVDCSHWGILAEIVEEFAGRQEGTYVVFGEDLPEGEIAEGLRDSFGAEPGDVVVEVVPDAELEKFIAQRWILPSGKVRIAVAS